jgi:hypothetical protein
MSKSLTGIVRQILTGTEHVQGCVNDISVHNVTFALQKSVPAFSFNAFYVQLR